MGESIQADSFQDLYLQALNSSATSVASERPATETGTKSPRGRLRLTADGTLVRINPETWERIDG